MHDREHEPDWQAVRAAVEARDQTRLAICKAFRISRGELARRIKANKWDAAERDDGRDRGLLLDGLRWALATDRSTGRSGIDRCSEGGGCVAAARLDARRPGAAGRQGRGRAAHPRQTKEMGELRQKIARRLEELDLH